MNPMMNPMSFSNDSGSGIPMFSKNGTALSNAERQKIAHRRGVCLTCGTKTHEVKVLGRTPLTNQAVYQGTCIRCNGGSVPSSVLNDWQARNQPSGSSAPGHHGRFRSAAFAVRAATAGAHPRASHGVGMTRTLTPPLGTALTAEVTPVRGVQRGGSANNSFRSRGGRNDSERSASATSLSRGEGRSSRMLARTPASEGSSSSVDRYASFGPQLSGSSLTDQIAEEGAVRQPSSPLPAPATPTTPTTRSGSSRALGSGANGTSPRHPNGAAAKAEFDEYRTDGEKDSFTLVRELQRNRERPNMLLSNLHGLRNLAEDKAGALKEVREVIELYFDNDTSTNRRLVTVAIGAIWGICSKDDDKKKVAAEAGCLNLIVESLRVFKNDRETVQWALGALSSLALVEDNRQWIADNGGIALMLEALKAHQSDPAVFEWANRALYVMITAHEDNCNGGTSESLERNMVKLLESNGIKILIAAIKQHSEQDAVAECWAMRVLFRLQDRTADDAVNDVIRKLTEADLADICASTLKARSTTNDLFIATAEMLSILEETDASGSRNAADCVNAVMRFIMEKSATIDVKASGAKLLSILSRGDNQTKRQISENSCFKMLVTTMTNKLDNLTFLQSTMLLLCTLACDESSFDFSLLGDIKSAIEKIDERYPDDVQLNDLICDFVANNASVAQGQPDSVPVNVAARICISSIGAPATSPQIGRALVMICSQFPAASEEFAKGGGAQRLMENLCDTNVDVQTSSCAALTELVAYSKAALDVVLDESGLSTATVSLMVTESEVFAGCVLELISSVVTNSTKKILQLPDEIILGILQGIEMFPSLKKSACITIRNVMLVTVPGFNSLNTDGLVEALLGIIDDQSNPEDVVIEACGAVWAFCTKQPVSTNDLTLLLASLLGLCAIHKGNDSSPFNSAVLTEAAGALSSIMCCIRDNPVPIADNDIDLIVSILDLVIECDVGNVVLMNRMLDVILTLCLFAKETLIQFGVIVVVIDSMVEHEGNEEIQQKGCAMLALLASTENLQVNLSIAETDGIDMIVSAIAGFPDNVQIQTDACRALSHLSIDHESRMLISSQGGLILLVNAMIKYPDETDLLEAACSALLNLSSDAEEQVLTVSNVVEVVIATMKHQVLSTRLQEKSLGVLQNISMRSKDAKRAIAGAGGIGAIAFTIKEFMGSPSVMERAFTAMWSLAVLEDNQTRIADEQGISLVVNGMMANIAYEKVQKQACGCLCTLSTNSRNKTLIRDIGGVDSIVYAMWAHYNSDALLIEACRALSSLAVNVQTNEVMIATEGEISAILAAMRRFPDSERLQEHACVALRNFMLSSDNAALVRYQQDEVEQLMNVAATRYPNRCADRAMQVLQSIRG